METKFTVGKWLKKPIKNGVIDIVTEHGTLICEIDYFANKYGSPTPIGAEANARLISAAPDMLTALNDLLIYCRLNSTSQLDPLIRNAENAIKKATTFSF